jgi:hypothetical protein
MESTNRRCKHRGVADDAEKAKNRTKSRVRAKVSTRSSSSSGCSALAACGLLAGEERAPAAGERRARQPIHATPPIGMTLARETCAQGERVPQQPQDRRLLTVLRYPGPYFDYANRKLEAFPSLFRLSLTLRETKMPSASSFPPCEDSSGGLSIRCRSNISEWWIAASIVKGIAPPTASVKKNI